MVNLNVRYCSFVLIITNILGDIHEIQNAPGFEGIQDAPLQSFHVLSEGVIWVVTWFEYIESIAFYCGLGFGIYWVIYKYVKKRKEKKAEFTPKEPATSLDERLEISDRKSTVSIESIKEKMKTKVQPEIPIEEADDL